MRLNLRLEVPNIFVARCFLDLEPSMYKKTLWILIWNPIKVLPKRAQKQNNPLQDYE